MKFREKLQQERPECVGESFDGGCCGCPSDYGYEKEDKLKDCDALDCGECWDREMPETEDSEWEQVAVNSEIRMTKDGDIRFRCSGPTISNEEPAGDPVNAPSHYCVGGYECWEVMEAVFGKEAVYNFALCNAFKYLWRAGKKDDLLQDLRKAAKNLEKAIEVKEKQQNEQAD